MAYQRDNAPKPLEQNTAKVAVRVEANANAEVPAGPRRKLVRVVRRPRQSTWLYWLTAATSDIADSIDRTNAYLEQDRPAKAAEAFVDVFSLRRLAVLLPGGSVLRGARRPPAPIPSAVPSHTAAAPVPPATPASNKQ